MACNESPAAMGTMMPMNAYQAADLATIGQSRLGPSQQQVSPATGGWAAFKSHQQLGGLLQQPLAGASAVLRGPTGVPVYPINDFHLLDNPNKYSDEEKQARVALTAVYRLIDIYGWSMGIYNHATVKVKDGEQKRLLIHPHGLHYNEITASSLLKIDMHSGAIVDHGTTNFEVNKPGFIIHSAIHLARPELKCVIHLHYPPVSAVSSFKYGLLPVCQEQALLGKIAYLDYAGILTERDESDAIGCTFTPGHKVMILRNHGLIVGGETIDEAFYLLTNLMRACEVQNRLLTAPGVSLSSGGAPSGPLGTESLIMMTDEAAQQAYYTVQNSRYPVRQLVPVPATTTQTNTNSIEVSGAKTLGGDVSSDESTTSGNESDLDSTTSTASSSGNLVAAGANGQHHPSRSLNLAKKVLKRQVVGHINMFEMDFEAHVRFLDLCGHHTGYKYKRPLIRCYK